MDSSSAQLHKFIPIRYLLKCNHQWLKWHNDARFPSFHYHSSIAILPFLLAVAVSVHRCRCHCRCVSLCLGSSASMIGWPATAWNNRKIELDPTSTEEQLWQFFAVYSCNGMEFSYVIFTEQWNFKTVERRNGNGRMTTEWWNRAWNNKNRATVDYTV